MYYFFPGTHIEELEAEKLMGGSLGVEHTHDMLVLFVNLIVGLENHPPVQRDSSLPVLYIFMIFCRQSICRCDPTENISKIPEPVLVKDEIIELGIFS